VSETQNAKGGARSGDAVFGFDTAAMWGLMQDVQRLGFDTASAVIDQFRQMSELTMPGPSRREADAPADRPVPEGRGEAMGGAVDRIVDASVDLMQASWEVFSSFIEASSQRRSAGVESPAVDHVVLPTTPQGGTAVGQLWLHNTTADEASVELHAGHLLRDDGSAIRAKSVTLDPARVDALEPGANCEIRITIVVPDDVPAGSYHGLVVASTKPETLVAVSLEVATAAS